MDAVKRHIQHPLDGLGARHEGVTGLAQLEHGHESAAWLDLFVGGLGWHVSGQRGVDGLWYQLADVVVAADQIS